MKQIFFAAALAAAPTTVSAEPSFRAEFHQELQNIGLEKEAFLYALRWAADADPHAEYVVAYALLDGVGVESDPVAAINFVCGPRSIDEFEVRKLLISANLRLIGSGLAKMTCDN